MKRILFMLLASMPLALTTACSPHAAVGDDAKSKSPLVCSTLPGLLERFHEEHVLYGKQDKAVLERVAEVYADSIDPAKSLFTRKEFKKIKKRITTQLEAIEDGNCEDFAWIAQKELERHQATEAFVKEVMSAGDFALDTSVELVVDADKRKRPKDDKERDALRVKLVHFQLANYMSAGIELEEAKKKVVKRYELISKRISERDTEDIYSEFLNAYSAALDPHSSYFSKEDLEDFRISMDLSLEGIGAVLISEDGFTVVREIVPGGAADREGQLKPEDKIVAVAQGRDGAPTPVIDMALSDVVRLIRGKKGTEVKLGILRKGKSGNKKLDINIIRDKIDLKQRAAKLRWEQVDHDGTPLKLAILELPSFYGGKGDARSSTEDVKALLKEATEGGADGMLLDLSRNGGGLLQAAVDISGFFVASGPIVGVDGRNKGNLVLEDLDSEIVYNGPLVVLTSRASASASEILAGSLRDYGRAVVVGDSHTYGKGTVQNVITLPPGFGALKVTTGMFYLPGGQSTQNIGVEADIVVSSVLDSDDFGEKHMPYALPPRTIDTFKGFKINANGDSGFTPVASKLIKKLAKASSKRIKDSEDFKEVKETLEKRKKDDGVLKIAELMEDKKDDEKEDEEKEDELTPQAEEALNILSDLVVAMKKK